MHTNGGAAGAGAGAGGGAGAAYSAHTPHRSPTDAGQRPHARNDFSDVPMQAVDVGAAAIPRYDPRDVHMDGAAQDPSYASDPRDRSASSSSHSATAQAPASAYATPGPRNSARPLLAHGSAGADAAAFHSPSPSPPPGPPTRLFYTPAQSHAQPPLSAYASMQQAPMYGQRPYYHQQQAQQYFPQQQQQQPQQAPYAWGGGPYPSPPSTAYPSPAQQHYYRPY